MAELIYENQSSVTSFMLVGFTDMPHLHLPLLLAFYLMYILTITGNGLILVLVLFHTTLKKPMYFFLCHLASLDICYTSITLPNLIWLHSQSDKHISFAGCFLQQYLYIAFAVSEYFLLAAMAYDRYVAICNPLRYSLIMSPKTCLILAQGCWVTGFVSSSFPVSLSSHFSFCKSHEINHFFCDLTALVKLSCGKNTNIVVLILVESLVLGLMPFMFTLASYTIILRTIFSIRVKDGRSKAFSTCASHLTVVVLFYGTMIVVYIRPPSMYMPDHDKLFALLYTAVIPMINPMIYTLRNGEVNNIMKKVLNLSFCKVNK
ncbi:olfactory receptor 5B21-like [Hyla sarda]|uniref:olfactory receptor 5B21-like n=1 Tax=Hyla sarda TaxID=327740 RepID=UPI0024C35101|nr:olfactory receptor 5B21-like [Hyla sarda]